MNYTASVTLTGNDQLSTMLASATTNLNNFVGAAQRAGAQMTVVNQQFAQTATTTTAITNLANQVQTLAARMQSLAGAGRTVNSLNSALNNVGQSSHVAASGAHAFTDAITGGMRSLSLFYVRAHNIYELFATGLGFRFAISEAIEFSATMETSRLSIAASLVTFKEYRDTTGQVVTGHRAYSEALKDAESAQRGLRARVFETTATFSELTIAYQRLIAASGKSSATERDFADLTVAMSNMAAAWGVSLDTVSTQFQSVLLGVSRVSSRVGGFLRSQGVDAATIRSWRENGVAVQELNKILVAFKDVGEEVGKTWQGISSNVEDSIQNVLGEGMQTTIKATIGVVQAFTAQLVDIGKSKETGVFQFAPGVIEDVKAISDALARTIDRVRDMVHIAVPGFIGLTKVMVEAADYASNLATVFKPLAIGVSALFSGAVTQDIIAFGVALAGVAGTAALIAKAGTQLAAMSVAMADAQVVGMGFSAAISSAGVAVTGAMATFVSGIAVFTAWVGAIGLAIIALGKVGEKIATTRAEVEDFNKKSMDHANALSHMTLTAEKYGVIITETSSLEKLVAVRHEKAIATLTELGKHYGGVALDAKEFDEAVAKVGISLVKSASAPKKLTDELRKMGDEVALLKNPTKAFAIELERANKVQEIWAEHLGNDKSDEERAAAFNLISVANERAAEQMKKANEQLEKQNGLMLRPEGTRKTLNSPNLVSEFKDYEEQLKSFYRTTSTDDDNQAFSMAKKSKMWEDYEKLVIRVSNVVHEKSLQGIQDDHNAEVAKLERLRKELLASDLVLHNSEYAADVNKTIDAGIDKSRRELADNTERYNARWASRAKQDYNALYGVAITTTEGITAAFVRMNNDMRTEGQQTADFLYAQWKTLGDGIASAFSDVVTNGGKGLEDILKGIFSSVVKEFGHQLTLTFQKLSADVEQMGPNQGPNPSAPLYSSPYAGQGGAANAYLGAAATGWGAGSSIGQGMIGNQVGGAVGAMAGVYAGTKLGGTVGGGYGAIIGAIIGAIAGGLFNPSTEKTYAINSSSITGSSIKGDNGQSAIDALINMREGFVSSLADLFKAAGTTDRYSIISALNQKITDYITKMDFHVSAGSEEDIQKDLKKLFTEVIPKENLHQMFGNQIVNGKDYAGISGGSYYNEALSDTAPITMLLKSLGFTVDAILDINRQIDTKSPEAFMKYLTSLVGIVVNGNKLIANLNLSSGGTIASIDAARNKSLDSTFTDAFAEVTELAKELSLYTGDEQISRAQTVLALAQQRYEEEIKSITTIIDLSRSITASIRSQLIEMGNTGKDAGWLRSDNYRRLDQIMPLNRFELDNPGQIGAAGLGPEEVARLASEAQSLVKQIFDSLVAELNSLMEQISHVKDLIASIDSSIAAQLQHMGDVIANKGVDWLKDDKYRRISSIQASIGSGTLTPDEIAKLTQEAQSLISEIFSTLESRLQKIKALQESFASLQEKWASSTVLMGDQAPTILSVQEHAAQLQRDITAAAKLSGQDQLDALDRIHASASSLWSEQEQVYKDQIGLIATIHANLLDMTSSIDKQIRDIDSQFPQGAEGRGYESTIRGYNSIKYAGGKLTDAQQKDYDETTQKLDNVMREEAAQRAMDNIRALQEQLKTASTPDEVKRLTGEIQSEGQSYLGSFRADDPRRREASEWLKAQLEDTKTLATAAYKAMEAQAQAIIDSLKLTAKEITGLLGFVGDALGVAMKNTKDEMEALVPILRSLNVLVDTQLNKALGDLRAKVDAVNREISLLSDYLGRLNEIVSLQLNATIDSLIAKNNALAGVIQTVIDLFTKLTGPAVSAGGGGGGGGKGPDEQNPNNPSKESGGSIQSLMSGFDNMTTSARSTKDAIDTVAKSGNALADTLDRINRNLGGDPPARTASNVVTTETIVSDVVNTLKRNPRLLNTRA